MLHQLKQITIRQRGTSLFVPATLSLSGAAPRTLRTANTPIRILSKLSRRAEHLLLCLPGLPGLPRVYSVWDILAVRVAAASASIRIVKNLRIKNRSKRRYTVMIGRVRTKSLALLWLPIHFSLLFKLLRLLSPSALPQ